MAAFFYLYDMNAIESLAAIDFYNNLTASGRFERYEYDRAVNDSIVEFIDSQFGDDSNQNPKSFEWNQSIRDNLYTLIKTATPSITNGSTVTNQYYSFIPSHINYPSDYKNLISLNVVISSNTYYCRPTTYNELGPLLIDSFKRPQNTKPYYVEDSTGYTIWRGPTGSITTATLNYIKIPNTFTIGKESQVIITGGTLTNLLIYYALEDSVYAGTFYAIGNSITGTGAALTSGSVILSTNTVSIDLPPEVHDIICKAASSKMLATISMFPESQAIQAENKKDL